jgi:hypothetical protein
LADGLRLTGDGGSSGFGKFFFGLVKFFFGLWAKFWQIFSIFGKLFRNKLSSLSLGSWLKVGVGSLLGVFGSDSFGRISLGLLQKDLPVTTCIRICFSTEDQASILTRPLRVRHGLNPDSDSEPGVEGTSEFGVAGNATEFGVEANAAFEVEGIAAFGIATELGVAGNATAFEVEGNAAFVVEGNANAALEVEGNAVEFEVVGNAKPSPEAPEVLRQNLIRLFVGTSIKLVCDKFCS